MRFGILGPLEVRAADGETVPVGGPRPRALLVMLLLNAGRAVSVEQLITGQYGDDPPPGAANAVQAHVSRLRRALSANHHATTSPDRHTATPATTTPATATTATATTATATTATATTATATATGTATGTTEAARGAGPGPGSPAGLASPPVAEVIEFTSAGYRLAVAPEDVDAHRFERLAGEGRHLLAAGSPRAAASVLRDALALWRGPALADLPYGAAQAARLDELRLAATEDLIEAELALPEGHPAAELRALVDAHPLRERLRGQLMRALHAAGRQAEALAEFESVRRLLAEELGADPSAELAAIHVAILRAAAPEPARRRGVPAQLTSFVGREAELDRLAALGDARLVTLLGPGGIGKTRLAVEYASRNPRVSSFVDLSPLEDGEQVPAAVLAALGLRDTGFHSSTSDPVRRLVAALDGRQLLILDNCEHVIEAAAALARTLLAECPELSVLATSREPLGLTGESMVQLSTLDDTAAETLFRQRAEGVRPAPIDGSAVAEICAALDGLPLAIELAAARLRQYPVEEIAARLVEHGRFRLLARGDRTAAARHRTLRAAVEWSWDLLGADERLLARRFAVFTGGAPLAAIEAVCGVPDADEVLADLVDKSFVEADGHRYRMLDTIRLFCAEQLSAAGEQETVRRAHATFHLGLAQQADPHLRRSEQLDWLARLSAEHGNLMAALRWASRSADPADRATGRRLVAALAAYWWLSGRRSEAGEPAAALLDEPASADLADKPDRTGKPARKHEPTKEQHPAQDPDWDEEYVACVVHAVPRASEEHWKRALDIVRRLDRELRHPFGIALWGMASGPSGGPAERLLAGDAWTRALGRFSDGLLAVTGGRVADGERELRDVLETFRGLGERWGIAQTLDWLAFAASWRGEWSLAHDRWAEALRLLEELGATQECADLLCRRAECLIRQGELSTAADRYRLAAELSARAGSSQVPSEVEWGLATVARLRGEHREAVQRLERVLNGGAVGDFVGLFARPRALTGMGRAAEAAGNAAEALRWHGEAVAALRGTPFAAELASAVEGLAGAILAGAADVPGGGGPGGAEPGGTGAPAGGPPERAAFLLGAAVALRGMSVTGDADVARVAAEARDRLGPAGFAAAYHRGAAMSPAEVTAMIHPG